jgi:hypothetical protein
MKSTIPNLQIYLPKMANSEKLGVRAKEIVIIYI